ncbi:unnamed protein product [Phytomonas sp. EM1]|nr:unnamed protein product [Phytomonas sp. EM1]|eukprot:CCW61187.1 unnamed protein product [Phytomonas sp. isolate EM1]
MELITVRRFTELSEDHIQRCGKYVVAVAAAYYIITSFRSIVPADVKYAIEAHMPQGYDRSLIAARLEQRHTKHLLMKHLPLAKLREALRLETDRQAKLRLWDQTLHLNLTGLLAASYLHSLTITLFTLKNTVRVLIFLLRRREEERVGRTGFVPGAISKLRAWWVNGTRAVMMEKVVQLMSRRLGQATSPFAEGGLDEETATSWERTAAEGGGEREGAGERERGKDLTGLEGDGFSVRGVLRVAGPRLLASAQRVVAEIVESRPSHFFGAANLVTRRELQGLFRDLAAGMERRVGVAAWTGGGLPASPVAEADGVSGGGAFRTPNEDGEADDVVEFPAGSTAMLGHDGKVMYPRAGAPHGRCSATFSRDGNPEDASYEPLGRQYSVGAVDFPCSSASMDAGETSMDTLHQEREVKAQSTGFFQELLCSISVEELVLDHAAEVLNRSFRQILENLSNVKSYDEVTDSVKMLMFIAALEAPRQRLYDAEFDIKSYLKLFCEETVRSTCSQ